MNHVQHQLVLENDHVNKLSLLAEIFFHRLINVVDRYGCFDARPMVLRARLYTLKLDDVTCANMTEWLTECSNAGLITCYEVDGLPYLQIAGFKRRMGPRKTDCPEPPEEVSGQTKTTARPPKNNEGFEKELYKRENTKYLNRLAQHIRQREVKRSWVQAFNEHLKTEGRQYTVDNEWLGHLERWLPLNIQRLMREELNGTPIVRGSFAPAEV